MGMAEADSLWSSFRPLQTEQRLFQPQGRFSLLPTCWELSSHHIPDPRSRSALATPISLLITGIRHGKRLLIHVLVSCPSAWFMHWKKEERARFPSKVRDQPVFTGSQERAPCKFSISQAREWLKLITSPLHISQGSPPPPLPRGNHLVLNVRLCVSTFTLSLEE